MGFLKKQIKEEENDLKSIWRRIRNRDFSGTTGIAVKNSMYQISINFISKIGSLIFTILVARLLMPELFGLYSLALSTIFIFVSLSDFGIGQTLTRFLSVSMGKDQSKKAKSYFIYLTRIKIVLIFVSILILIASANFISITYYKKPLFLALIFGSFYILFSGIFVILKSSFEAMNNFKTIFYQEIIFQLIRVLVIPLAILLLIKGSISGSSIVMYIILGLSFCYLVSFIFLFSKYKKLPFLKEKASPLSKREKSRLKKFISAIFFIILSGVFFSYIDRIMLGYFVSSEFIGYYTAAFGLIYSSAVLITFSTALLPLFSRLKKERLKSLYEKSLKIALLSSVALFVVFLIFSPLIINIVFGKNYSSSILILRLFSPLVILLPLISLLTTRFIAIGKPFIVSKILIISTLINVILNYILISKLVVFGPMYGVYGAIIATILSNLFYVLFLMFYKRAS